MKSTKHISIHWKYIVFAFLLLGLVIWGAVWCKNYIYQLRTPNRNFQRFQDARQQYEQDLEVELQAQLCTDLMLSDYPDYVLNGATISVQGECIWQWNNDHQRQDWDRACTVDITLPDSFQDLSYDDTKTLLYDLNRQCNNVFTSYNQAFDNSIVYEGEKDFLGDYPGVGYDALHISSDLTLQVHSGGSVYTVLPAANAFYQDGVRIQEEAETAQTISAPYVGMSESLISSTDLGEPEAKIRHNYELDGHGGQVLTNLYDFKENGWLIFTARCIDGKVTEVWDSRDQVDTSKPYSSNRKRNSSNKADDSYNAADYTDAEEFYDEYYDEFFDYEDAEDYYDDYS